MSAGSNRRFALIGRRGVGKSQVAALIQDKTGLPVIKTGAICRQIAMLLFGEDSKASTQRLDDALTTLDPSIFLLAALRSAPTTAGFLVDSLRFRSDVDIARSYGCVLVRVVAEDHLRAERLRSRGQRYNPSCDGLHRSEIELDRLETDDEIINDASLVELARSVDDLCMRWR